MHALLLYAVLVSFGPGGERLNPAQPMSVDYYDLVVACDPGTNKCWMLPQVLYPGKSCETFRQVETRKTDRVPLTVVCADTDQGAQLNVAWIDPRNLPTVDLRHPPTIGME